MGDEVGSDKRTDPNRQDFLCGSNRKTSVLRGMQLSAGSMPEDRKNFRPSWEDYQTAFSGRKGIRIDSAIYSGYTVSGIL